MKYAATMESVTPAPRPLRFMYSGELAGPPSRKGFPVKKQLRHAKQKGQWRDVHQ